MSRTDPNRAEQHLLAWALDLKRKGFDGILTGRRHRKHVAERCVAAGWLETESMVVSDGDGFTIEPERWRQGYKLTAEGRALIERLQREDPEL